MENLQNVKTQSTKPIKSKDATKANSSAVTRFLDSREKSALTINFHETKIGRLADSFAARYVKNLANQIAKSESTDTKTVKAASVINDFRQGKFSSERLTENRLRIYRNNFSRQTASVDGNGKKQKDGLEFTDEDVKRDVMRMSALIWKSGNFA